MPWKETNVMEQRTLFIDAWLTRQYSKTELCQRFGISRPTADKWIQRYRQNGLAGLADQSRRPHHSPNATDDALRERLIAAKQQRPHWGAKKLLGLLNAAPRHRLAEQQYRRAAAQTSRVGTTPAAPKPL
jgi:transposase